MFTATMGDDSLILREDGYLNVETETSSILYHSNLNVILLSTVSGVVHVLDVNSGVILQSSSLAGSGSIGIDYVPAADKVIFWDSSGIGARSDYNGVLLLHAALQQPLPSTQADQTIKLELVLSEAVLLYQCLQSIDVLTVQGVAEVILALGDAINEASDTPKKGVKAQKWCTVHLELPQSSLRLVANGVVMELQKQSRRIPALAIASAVGQRVNDLVPGPRPREPRALMFSEAARKETFRRWPHMDYKWALPAQMAQAGFYHQPSSTGDDRAMCFTCLVCLVCWERSDEPWAEHERHSPNCPFVRGEYTHNVPLSVTNATSSAVPCSDIAFISKGNSNEAIATGTVDGKVTIYKFDGGLKQQKCFTIAATDSVFNTKLTQEMSKATSKLELSSLAIIGTQQHEDTLANSLASVADGDKAESIASTSRPPPSIVCGVSMEVTCNQQDRSSLNYSFVKPNVISNETVKAMNDQNEAKSNSISTKRMLFLLTYNMNIFCTSNEAPVTQSSSGSNTSKPGGSKKVSGASRHQDAYDKIMINEHPCSEPNSDGQITVSVLASSSKDLDSKFAEPKKLLVNKTYKVSDPSSSFHHLQQLQSAIVYPPHHHHSSFVLSSDLVEATLQEYIEHASKPTKSPLYDSDNMHTDIKMTDQADAAAMIQQSDDINYINMNGTLDMQDLKWYKLNSDNSEMETALEENLCNCVPLQCLPLPPEIASCPNLKISHLVPSNDKKMLLVVVSGEDPAKTTGKTFDTENEMDVDICCDLTDNEMSENAKTTDKSDSAYILVYNWRFHPTIVVETPICFKEFASNEAPIDICMLPANDAFACIGRDGSLRLVELQNLTVVAEAKVSQGKFVSVAYCTSIERLSASTENGALYFYAIKDGEGDSNGEIEDDEFSNIDLEMMQKPSDLLGEASASSTAPPVLLANKTNLTTVDLQNLLQLTGMYGSAPAIPYSAVVPGCWCELTPAQRARSDQHNNRMWRLQNTASTWDEHMLELTLPYSASLAHVELGFTLHSPCTTPPNIQVTLLKQHLHGIGYRKDNSYFSQPDDVVKFSLIDSDAKSFIENPVNSTEYLRAHNAEILAGPLLLAQGLDLSQQSGTLTLTSPRLHRIKGRTFLIHIKTLFDPSKEISPSKVSSSFFKSSDGAENFGGNSERSNSTNSKKTEFIGCDWLHQLSIIVRNNPHTEIPQERQQRIAMLDSNAFMCNLFDIASDNKDSEKQSLALDLLIWVVSIRLQRFRVAKSESSSGQCGSSGSTASTSKTILCHTELQQVECAKIVERNIDVLVKNCILCAKRSIAKKSVKVILLTSEGVKNLPDTKTVDFDTALLRSVTKSMPYLATTVSPGSIKWLTKLAMHVAPLDTDGILNEKCFKLLENIAKQMKSRINPYHMLLQTRFGLYGMPLEASVFDVEPPALGKSSTSQVTYASVVSGESNSSTAPTRGEIDLRDLYNLADGKGFSGMNGAWWAQTTSIEAYGSGIAEEMALHVSCHSASEGTKLEQTGTRQQGSQATTVTSDPAQLWMIVNDGKDTMMDGNMYGAFNNTDDQENSLLMDCEVYNKDKYNEGEQENIGAIYGDKESWLTGSGCGIPWQQLVWRPPQQTLLVERMHSGARRYIVLDFGHPVRLTDLIIPSCSDLVTLSIDLWLHGEDQDAVKLVFDSDIAVKNLIMTDIQPPPLCRYLKITTIGRYGMSAMKCKIPLGWFFGEIAEIANEQASIATLTDLHQDIMCRFRLAAGKLTDLLNVYLDQYNGNAAHMSAYLKNQQENDPRVLAAYQECMDLQQQLHTVTNILKKLKKTEGDDDCREFAFKSQLQPDFLLERISTDKLRVIAENVIDMLLYFNYETSMKQPRWVENRPDWCSQVVSGLLLSSSPRTQASLATLLTRTCGKSPWWGNFLADTLVTRFAPHDDQPFPRDRFLILLIYMARKTLFTGCGTENGVVEAAARKALQLFQTSHFGDFAFYYTSMQSHYDPILMVYILVYLAATLDSASAPSVGWWRWDFVTGGRPGGFSSNESNGGATGNRNSGCIGSRIHRRKLHKRLVTHKGFLEDLEAARRVHVSQQVQALSTLSSQAANLSENLDAPIKNQQKSIHPAIFQKYMSMRQQRFKDLVAQRVANLGRRTSGSGSSSVPSTSKPDPDPGISVDLRLPRLISPQLARQLAQVLITQILNMDFTSNSDLLILTAKVIGRVWSICGGLAGILEEQHLLGLARAAATHAPWPSHALTTLLQDLVEYEGVELPTGSEQMDSEGQGSSWRLSNSASLQASTSRSSSSNNIVPKTEKKTIQMSPIEYHSPSVLSDCSDLDEFPEQFILDKSVAGITIMRKSLSKHTINTSISTSFGIDCRMESGMEVAGEIVVRRLSMLGSSTLCGAIESPIPTTTNVLGPVPDETIIPSSSIITMLASTFDTLFPEFKYQDDCTFMERVISLWLTLNGSCNVGAPSSTNLFTTMADGPKIRLSTAAVNNLLEALVLQNKITLRCWVLAVQCLTWVCDQSVQPVEKMSGQQMMADVIIKNPYFVPVLVKLVSTKISFDGIVNGSENSFAGVGASTALQCLLTRLSGTVEGIATELLSALCSLAGPGGAMRMGTGALDLQATLLRTALSTSVFERYSQEHLSLAMSLIDSVAYIACEWTCGAGTEAAPARAEGARAALGGLLSGVLAGADAPRAPSPPAIAAKLLKLARALLSVPLQGSTEQEAGSSSFPTGESQTDESKAFQQHSGEGFLGASSSESTPPVRVPRLADTVLQHQPTMQRLFKTLANCNASDVVRIMLSLSTPSEFHSDPSSASDEVFKLMVTLADTATHPTLILTTLFEFLRNWKGKGDWALSEDLVWFTLHTLERPETRRIFVELGGIHVVCERLMACHKAQLNSKSGLVSSLMNYLKLPAQLINLSTSSGSSSSSKKVSQTNVETAEGLINFAPLGTISTSNPAATGTDILLSGGGAGGGAGGAHRRVRAAAWSYHFYSDEPSMAFTVGLPHAVQLHELQIQPHVASLASCPSAVGMEAGCGSVVAPLGPPQPTAGMTFIRLALSQPVIANTVVIRMYKPKDSSNMGLLHLRILGTPAFVSNIPNQDSLAGSSSAGWLRILALCLSDWPPDGAAVRATPAGLGLLWASTGLLAGGGEAAAHAHSVLLCLARASHAAAAQLMHLLLGTHAVAHAQGYQHTDTTINSTTAIQAVCELLYQLCTSREEDSSRSDSPTDSRTTVQKPVEIYLNWLAESAQIELSQTPHDIMGGPIQVTPSSANIQCLASILWAVKENDIVDNPEELVSDDLFELLYAWSSATTTSSLLKKSLDAVLCSICYIRPDLFKLTLERLGFGDPSADSPLESMSSMHMSSLTDDKKEAHGQVDANLLSLSAIQLRTVAAACMSPRAIDILLQSDLLITVVTAIKQFSTSVLQHSDKSSSVPGDTQMTDSDKAHDLHQASSSRDVTGGIVPLRSMPMLVEWLKDLCYDRSLKDWLGGTIGSCFWKPLLLMLCLTDPSNRKRQECDLYTELEERTIELFSALTICHPANQQLFATTLHNILKCHRFIAPGVGEAISGFTRSLIVRLLLWSSRARVAVSWGGGRPCIRGLAARSGGAGAHPSLHRHALLSLPLHTTVREMVLQHVMASSSNTLWPSTSNSTHPPSSGLARSSSDSGLAAPAEAWQLSVAAAKTARDKRAKEASNASMKQQQQARRGKGQSNKQSGQGGSGGQAGSSGDNDCTLINGLTVYVGNQAVPVNATIGQLCHNYPQKLGPHLTLVINSSRKIGDRTDDMSTTNMPSTSDFSVDSSEQPTSLLGVFASAGGLARLAQHLPPLLASPPNPPQAPPAPQPDTDWIKLDDIYEDVGETAAGVSTSGAADAATAAALTASGVPAHALLALGLLLRLPGYAEALLREGPRALMLLRLLLGVTEDAHAAQPSTTAPAVSCSLGAVPFSVLAAQLEAWACGSDDGRVLRRLLLRAGALRLLLACLAVFTHHPPDGGGEGQSSNSGTSRTQGNDKVDKSQLYWAKGTGFGTGSTQQSWNVEQALVRQKTEEEHVTVLLQVLASYINPGECWPPANQHHSAETSAQASSMEPEPPELPHEFIDLLNRSALLPALCSYLRNDSVLDMSRHIPLYICVLRVARALWARRSMLSTALQPLPPLLQQMAKTTTSYANKLQMNKKSLSGKSTYSQRKVYTNGSEITDEDEGLAMLIMDIQATAALMCRSKSDEEGNGSGIPRSVTGATREARYIEIMKRLQFETFEMIAECPEKGYRFTVSYHFEAAVRESGERTHPQRMKRLAQEAATLATSLPLSYSSSVFVRTDTDRLDVMKVLITGPSDTPYANGCFELDVYFPSDYPSTPMLINLETTGRHSVRFNPNLYNDGKVCLSVLNTWHGRPEEKWNAHTSSFLQVLVSIQSLILVPEPYFNEPGYERSRGTPTGSLSSTEYNSNIYQACVRWAMLEQLRAPTPCFKQVIQTHFWIKRNEICQVIESWIAELDAQSEDKRTQRNICFNAMALKRHYAKLKEELARLPVPAGLEDLDIPFQPPASSQQSSPAVSLEASSAAADQMDQDMEKLVSQVCE